MRAAGAAILAGLLVVAAAPALSANATVTLRGAGATFPAPLYERWIQAFRKAEPGVAITYDVVGSGEGARRFIANAVDFGASDAALSDEQIARVTPGARLVPVTAGIVVLAYNVPGLERPLKLPRSVVADIFAGRIRMWNDPRLAAANPGVSLPAHTIAVVARQDGSGTTFALTNHLSAVSADWRDRGPGIGTLVDWGGRAMLARGNEGVAGRIKGSHDAIGYVEYHFAKKLKLSMAAVANKAGRYVEPSERSGEAALAANVGRMPANLRLFIPDPDGDDAYPIVSLSWLLVYESYWEREKSAALRRFLVWALTEGQSLSREMGYIPLPPEVASRSLAAVDQIH
jgi:phosphate transport system substrate-binding protein